MRLQRRNVNTVMYGTETIASLGDQILNLLPKNWKYSKCFNRSKKNIRKWTTKECPRVYVKVTIH